MNVLPLVISFLIIFSLGLASLFQNHVNTQLEKRGIEGSINAQRKLRNSFASKEYKERAKETSLNSSANQSEKGREKLEAIPTAKGRKPSYFRETKKIKERGRLNIKALVAGPTTEQAVFLRQKAELLMSLLYKNTSLWKESGIPDLEHQILDGLLKNRDKTPLAAFAKNPKLYQIFYTMIQGTNTYTIGQDKGIPRFFDYFTLSSQTVTIDFALAPKIVMLSLVGESLYEKIEKKEMENALNKPLKQQEFKDLLQHSSLSKEEIRDLLLIFSFRKKDKSIDIYAQDKKTGITLHRRNLKKHASEEAGL